jgi:hypothetical protein
MNTHNLTKRDLLALMQELKQSYSNPRIGNITNAELSPELTEILSAVKQVTVHS